MKALFLFYLLPLLSSMLLAIPIKHSEKIITRLTTLSLVIPSFVSIYLFLNSFHGPFPLELNLAVIKVSGHNFPFTAWLDIGTFVMLGLTHILGLLVVKYSHGYLHLEKGYQRFFSTILFFIFGMEVLSLAGHMDLFFAGWEIVGFSSFLLIAFYRSQTRSVSNAWRIYNIYRVCDLGLLMGAVMGHILWHEATRFSALQEMSGQILSATNQTSLTLLTFFIIFASLGKSAQFPFHNWPSRAMEGPTPSSAIFYGALSIHAGVFLLIRMQPLWSHSQMGTVLIGVIGLLTLFFSSVQGRIQTNIKGQIAFASTSQIGLMFIELSLGFTNLVLIHLFCHALYRCFQLLVSPSVVASSSSLNNKVVFQRIKTRKILLDKLPTRLKNTFYVLGMTDFSMDISWRGFSFIPWKTIYWKLRRVISHPAIMTFLAALSVLSMSRVEGVDGDQVFSVLFALMSVYFALKSIFFHHKPFSAMRDFSLSLIGCMVSVYLLNKQLLHSIEAYFLPVTPFLILALIICRQFRNHDLRNFHALGTKHALAANVFMICFMVLSGMPVTTAFIGEDMLLEELLKHSSLITALIALCLMINGLLFAKIYSRLFMGREAL